MSSRRSTSTAHTLILCPELVHRLEHSRIALKAESTSGIEVGVLCGYSQPNSPIYVQCGIRVNDSPLQIGSKDNGSREESGKRLNQGLEVLDDALIRRFAYKLHRMLCGASQILGIYFLAPPDTLRKYTSSFESILKTLMLDRTTTAKANSTFYLLPISLSTGAISAQRYDFSDKNRSVTPEPMQIKVTTSSASDLWRVTTNWKLDLLLPVKRSIAGDHEHRFQKTVTKVLTDEINKIEAAVIVDTESESVVGDDDEDETPLQLLKTGANLKLPDILADIESSKTGQSSRKRGKSATVGSDNMENLPEHRYRLFSRHFGPNEANSFVVHQVASGALRIRGTIEGVAYVNRAGLSGRCLRLDLIKSLQSRVGILFDHIVATADSTSFGEEDADKTTLGRAKCFSTALPRRVLLSSLVQQASFCDYMLPIDTLESCEFRLRTCLGIDEPTTVQELERPVGDSAWTTLELSDLPSDGSSTKASENGPSSSSYNGTGLKQLLVWALVLIFGVALAVLFALPPVSFSQFLARNSS